jgi:hypothetical protein
LCSAAPEVHISAKTDKVRILDAYRLGKDGFLVIEKKHNRKRIIVYGPDLKIKWQYELINSLFLSTNYYSCVYYNTKNIFVFLSNVSFWYQGGGNYIGNSLVILSFDHEGHLLAKRKLNKMVGSKFALCNIMAMPEGLAVIKFKYKADSLDIFNAKDLAETSSKEVVYPSKRIWRAPRGLDFRIAGYDSSHSYQYSESYRPDSIYRVSVNVINVGNEDGLRKNFSIKFRPDSSYTVPTAVISTKHTHIESPRVTVKYDSLSKSLYFFGLCSPYRCQYGYDWKGYYIYQYSLNGDLINKSVNYFKDLAPAYGVQNKLKGTIHMIDLFSVNDFLYFVIHPERGKDIGIQLDNDLSVRQAFVFKRTYDSYNVLDINRTSFAGVSPYDNNLLVDLLPNMRDSSAITAKILEVSAGKKKKLFSILYQDKNEAIVGVFSRHRKLFDAYAVKL